MKHLDEGTIHAWLDDALDASQSRDIETHVAQCASCAAAVAEARGLIAGSSRILSALDDVPGGVIPQRPVASPAAVAAAAASGAEGHTAARRAPRRLWRAAPWVSGIAALFVAAVVLRTNPDVSRNAPLESPVAAMSQSPGAGTADSSPSAATEARTAPAASAASDLAREPAAGAALRSQSTPAPQRAAPSAAATRDAAVSAAPVAPTPRPGGEVTGTGSSQPAAPSAVTSGTLPTVPPSAGVPASERMKTSQPMQSEQAMQGLALESARSRTAPGLAGCYRVAAVRAEERPQAAAAVESGRRAQANAASPAPATARAGAARSDFAVVRLPALVRLDTTQVPRGLSVMDVATGAQVGWWTTQGDSARVDLGARGIVMISAAQRQSCP